MAKIRTVQTNTINITCTNNDYLPTQGTSGSAGFDLFSTEDININPNSIALIDTGITIEFPDNIFGIIKSRSGISYKHGIKAYENVIDSDYRGAVKVVLSNASQKAYTVSVGDRIAQLVFLPRLPIILNIVDNFDETDRGAGGFGSTGK